jgi:hypothetical protein
MSILMLIHIKDFLKKYKPTKTKQKNTMKRTKNLSLSVVKDAIAVCNSIYRLNASAAIGYAFSKTPSGRSVECGEYVYRGYEDKITSERFDGLISFEDKKLTDIKTGELVALS